MDSFLVQLSLPPFEIGLQFLGCFGMGPPQPSFPDVLGSLGDFLESRQTGLGIDQIQSTAIEGDVLGPFRLGTGPEQGIHTGGGGYSGAIHAFTAAADDPLQSRKRSDQGIIGGVGGSVGRADLYADLMEDLRQVGGLGELFDEGSEAAEGLEHFLQVAFRHKEQRLPSHQGQVALVEHIGEQVGGRSLGGFPIEAGSQSFHKLTVLLRVIAFHDGHQIVLTGKLAFHFQEVPMVFLV